VPAVEPQIASSAFAFRATVVPMAPGTLVVGLDGSTVAERGTASFFSIVSRVATARVAVYAYGTLIGTVSATTATYAVPTTASTGTHAKAVRGVPTELAYVTDVPRGTVVVSAVATGCVLVAVPVLVSLTRITAKVLCATSAATVSTSSVTVSLVGPDGAAFDVTLPVESETVAVPVPPAPAQPAPVVDKVLAGTATYDRRTSTLTVHTVRPVTTVSSAPMPLKAWRLSPDAAASVPVSPLGPYTYTEIVTAPVSARTIELGHATVRLDGSTITISTTSTAPVSRAATMAPGEHHVCVVVTPTETSGYLDGVRFAGLAVEASSRAAVQAAAVSGAAYTG
ncbi:MAG: hypothetical protein EBZ77_18140, partial [Chitinophagia bacterium]|nr:hypothetical protein [Chitinophagia bacterium]